MSNTQVMIDIETMGTGSKAAIIALGAVKFDAAGGEDQEWEKFHTRIDLRSSVALGLEMDASTVEFWMKQPEAWAALSEHEPVDLASALEGFSSWFGTESLPVWGNGATFDNVIVRSAYRATGQPCPWNHWHDRCYRTIKNLKHEARFEMLGIKHYALDDARSQAYHLLRVAKELNIKLG